MIPKLGPMELIVILVVVLVLFGPKNLPKLGSALGATVKNLREGMDSKPEATATVAETRAAAPTVDEEPAPAAKPAPKHREPAGETVAAK